MKDQEAMTGDDDTVAKKKTIGDENSGSSGGGGGDGKKTTRSKTVPIMYPMLSDTNYGIWAMKMRIILRSLGVWTAVEGDEDEYDEEKDQDAMAAISQAVPDSVLMSIAEYATTREAWEALRETRDGEDKVKNARARVLKRQLNNMTMKNSESIGE